MTTPNATLSTVIEAQLEHHTAFFVPAEVNSFILDSADFFNLRKYLLAASLFPNDEATFAVLYPKSQLKEYVPDAVYDVCIHIPANHFPHSKSVLTRNGNQDLRTNLPIVQNHCSTFRITTIAPLTVLGNSPHPHPPPPPRSNPRA